MTTDAFLLICLCCPGQIAAPEVQSPDAVAVGTRVRITTSNDDLIGVVRPSTSEAFLRLAVDGSRDIADVRRSAIETIRIVFVPQDVPPGGTGGPKRHLVYVHGICPHSAGFSAGWWASLRPYAGSIDAADVHEVVWSQFVNPPGATATLTPEEQRLSSEIESVLEDRAVQEREPGAEIPPGGVFDSIGAGLQCPDDFVKYMTRAHIRGQILDEFDKTVEPLLRDGAEVEIISHSWGTVVAYEALRRMEGRPVPPGRVHNLFMAGSALSIGPVKKNLRERFPGGAKPPLVRRWVNLDAAFDAVGGRLKGVPYAVDVEFLDLPPVGCSLLSLPVCAHGSYFNSGNIAVNQDIFGYFISQ
jgi:hypothetical protein